MSDIAPRPREIVQVLEVDGQGRPKLAWVVDCGTGDAGIVEYRDGYRAPSGAVHEYDPLAGLVRKDE